MRRLWFVGLAAAVAVIALVAPVSATTSSNTTTWKVTVTNRTGGQPLSPPLFVVHKQGVHVWQEGTIASHGVAALAEDANNAVLEAALPMVHGVHAVSVGEGGAIPPGEARTYTVETTGQFNRLSVLTMLVNTNDGFTGLDAVRLHGNGMKSHEIAWDAGSEVNNERKASIPGPCCGNPMVRAPEGNLIRPHEGITGRGDLDPAQLGWMGDVAEFRIERH